MTGAGAGGAGGPNAGAGASRSGRAGSLTSIAASAGVSVSTVSKVLNGRTDVAPETRERLGRILRTYGYQVAPRSGIGVVDLLIGQPRRPLVGRADPRRGHRRGRDRDQRHRQPGRLGQRVRALAQDRDRARHPRRAQRALPARPGDVAEDGRREPAAGGHRPAGRAGRARSGRSAPPTGRAACPPPGTSSSSATAGSPPSAARTTCGPAGPGSTATAAPCAGPTCRSTRTWCAATS